MKKLLLLIITLLLLTGCAAPQPEVEVTPTPVPTENPYLPLCGQWTAETGDGSAVWYLDDDGTVRLPAISPDGYREIGGYGTWIVGDAVTVQVGDTLTLQTVQEDGFTKLYCPQLNVTLVRTADREAAYGAKFVEMQVSGDNFWDFFYFDQVPEPVDESGERIWMPVYVMRSSMYNQGLVYWGDRGFDMEMTYWTSYHCEAEQAPFGVTFLVTEYNSVTAEGTIVFIKSDHLTEHSYDGKTRRLVCATGQVWETQFESYRYGGYPY